MRRPKPGASGIQTAKSDADSQRRRKSGGPERPTGFWAFGREWVRLPEGLTEYFVKHEATLALEIAGALAADRVYQQLAVVADDEYWDGRRKYFEREVAIRDAAQAKASGDKAGPP